MTNSIYEHLNESTAVMKQRFVDDFSGDSINERWSVTRNGSSTEAIDDTIDGGAIITTAATTYNGSKLHFNQIRQYNHQGSIVIGVTKMGATSNTNVRVGMTGNTSWDTWHDSVLILYYEDGTVYAASYPASGSESVVSTGLTTDTNWHSNKIQCSSSNTTYYIDGVLRATKTTNLPSAKMQPAFQVYTSNASIRTGNIRYLEAYNT